MRILILSLSFVLLSILSFAQNGSKEKFVSCEIVTFIAQENNDVVNMRVNFGDEKLFQKYSAATGIEELVSMSQEQANPLVLINRLGQMGFEVEDISEAKQGEFRVRTYFLVKETE